MKIQLNKCTDDVTTSEFAPTSVIGVQLTFLWQQGMKKKRKETLNHNASKRDMGVGVK